MLVHAVTGVHDAGPADARQQMTRAGVLMADAIMSAPWLEIQRSIDERLPFTTLELLAAMFSVPRWPHFATSNDVRVRGFRLEEEVDDGCTAGAE
jgi:hypothetical protein